MSTTFFRVSILGVAAAIASLVLAILDPARTALAWLTAWLAVLTVVLGALGIVMIAHFTNANWFVVLRRRAEQVTAALPLLAVLGIPVIVGLSALYPWMHPALFSPADRKLLALKSAYLNVPFFVLRMVVYFAVWIWLAEWLRGISLRQDTTADPAASSHMSGVSAGGAVIYAFTVSFASFDWIMSLTPLWSSTIYGIYVWVGGTLGAIGLITMIVARDRHAALANRVTLGHFQALGNLTLTFAMLWAYMAFAQLLIYWEGNLPSEISWYVTRLRTDWEWLALLVAVGQFGVPFVTMLVRTLKRSPAFMVVLGGWVLATHYADVYWLVMPGRYHATLAGSAIDGIALLAVGCLTIAFTMWRAREELPVPAGDLRLAASEEYEFHTQ